MSFVSESTVKAVRKRHRCDGCGRHIEVGQPATRWAGMTDGDFGTAIYHPDCRAAEVALNHLSNWQYGDDWYSLRDLDRDDWPWLLDAHPVVAQRMGISPAPADRSADVRSREAASAPLTPDTDHV